MFVTFRIFPSRETTIRIQTKILKNMSEVVTQNRFDRNRRARNYRILNRNVTSVVRDATRFGERIYSYPVR